MLQLLMLDLQRHLLQVGEQTLTALGVLTCGDIIQKRGLLGALYSSVATDYFMSACPRSSHMLLCTCDATAGPCCQAPLLQAEVAGLSSCSTTAAGTLDQTGPCELSCALAHGAHAAHQLCCPVLCKRSILSPSRTNNWPSAVQGLGFRVCHRVQGVRYAGGPGAELHAAWRAC